MKKKLLSIILALVLCLSLLPMAAYADEAPETYGLWVGGTEVTSENAQDVLGDGSVSYVAENHCLTLKDASITGGYVYLSDADISCVAGIYSQNQLSIVLEGASTVTAPDGSSSDGIYVEGDLLAISGSGSLTVHAGDAANDNFSFGIRAANTMWISEASVYTYGGKGSSSCGLQAKELTLAQGCCLYAKAGDAQGSVAYSTGLSISGSLFGSGCVEVEDGQLYAIGGDAQGENSAQSRGIYGYYSSLFVTSDADDAVVYAAGGDASGDSSRSCGIVVYSGNLGFMAGNTTVEAGEAQEIYGIYAQKSQENTGMVVFQCEESQISLVTAAGSRPSFTGTTAEITAPDGTAICADGGIVISDTLTIADPENGYVSGAYICSEDGTAASSADIRLLTYTVSISGLTSYSIGIPVPAGWSINEAYDEDFCAQFGADSYYDVLADMAVKEGYTFEGFFTESGQLYSFDDPVTQDIRLTPRWTEDKPQESTHLPITAIPGAAAEGSQAEDPSQLVLLLSQYGTVMDTDSGKFFTDVHPVDHWATEAIDYVVSRGIFSGTGADTFSPDAPMTRGMLAVVLYNLEGKPGHGDGGSFEDVAQGSWYEDAIYWAAEKGIVTGYGDGCFGPEDSITREQLAVMLYRYAQYKGYDTTQGGMAIREFSDYDSISPYAMNAMAWAVNTGIIGGFNDGTLGPQGSATRAQTAKMLMKFIEG